MKIALHDRIKVWVDGAPHEICVIIGSDEPIIIKNDYVTNTTGEYHALKTALESIKTYEKYVIYTDSQVVAFQMRGLYKINHEHLLLLKTECENIIEDRGLDIVIEWVPREQNLAGRILQRKH